MFDWGGGQPGDTQFRQGAAVAGKTIQACTNPLRDSHDENERFFLQTFVHEVGHAFNLPHTWSRKLNPDPASLSFMNYPWYYPTGEQQFWANFRWELDDVELSWMRHANRADIIFGGNDWIGNNLSTEAMGNSALQLEVRTWGMYELGEPLTIELKLKNVSNQVQNLKPQLDPEDRMLRIFFGKRGQALTEYQPPMLRVSIPEAVDLLPGKSVYGSATLSYGAAGINFTEPGDYDIRACLMVPDAGFIVSEPARARVMSPARSTEELAYVLFTRDSAKLLYFGATARKSAALSKLAAPRERVA